MSTAGRGNATGRTQHEVISSPRNATLWDHMGGGNAKPNTSEEKTDTLGEEGDEFHTNHTPPDQCR